MTLDIMLIGFGAIVGLSLGMTGSGGSMLAIPLLIYGAGIGLHEALALSLLIVASIAAFGAIRQSLSGKTDWRAAVFFSLPGMALSPFVVMLSHGVNDNVRLSLFAAFMLFAAWSMITPSNWVQKISALNQDDSSRLALIAIGGGVAGCLAGFFGVGGGFVILPLLTLIFSMPYARAVGTSLACIAIISCTALIGHFLKGVILDLSVLIPFTFGGALGLMTGTHAINKIPERAARRLFALVAGSLAAYILIDKLII